MNLNKKISLISLGCAKNLVDSEILVGVLNHMRKEIKKLNDDEMYEMTTQLKKWFNKNK